MSIDGDHPALRRIEGVGLRTPLIVPSFSSRGFPEVSTLLDQLCSDLYGVCLVSAFDLENSQLPKQLMDLADVVVLDSGVYETKSNIVAADAYHSPPTVVPWTRDAYRAVLKRIPEEANVVAVSFDHYGPIGEQIAFARQDFEQSRAVATTLLLKPVSTLAIISESSIAECVPELARFSVFGVTEKELGDSLLERCRSLVSMRAAFTNNRSATPIHVFGTITPGAVLAYFLCGADIFDGLNWLRFAYSNTGLCPIPDTAFQDEDWSRTDELRILNQSRSNLRYLQRLQQAMQKYAREGSISDLVESFSITASAARVAIAAGSRFPGMEQRL